MMKTDFEVEMSEAFAARAAAVPADAATRLRSIDYRPREHRLRAPAVGAGVLAGAATAGTVLAVVLGSSAPAYAGWSATPASGTTAPSPSADASCQSQLAAVPAGPGGGATAGGTWDTVLTDVRGPFTVAMFQNNGAYAVCFTGTSFTEINEGSVVSASSTGQSSARSSVSVHGEAAGAGGTSTQSVSISNTASGSLQQVLQNHLTTTSDGPYTLIDGRTQPGVTGVTLVRDDGQDVVATVADGWFVRVVARQQRRHLRPGHDGVGHVDGAAGRHGDAESAARSREDRGRPRRGARRAAATAATAATAARGRAPAAAARAEHLLESLNRASASRGSGDDLHPQPPSVERAPEPQVAARHEAAGRPGADQRIEHVVRLAPGRRRAEDGGEVAEGACAGRTPVRPGRPPSAC